MQILHDILKDDCPLMYVTGGGYDFKIFKTIYLQQTYNYFIVENAI